MSNDFSFPSHDLLRRRQETFLHSGNLISCRFDRDNGRVPQLSHAKRYVDRWKELGARGVGLLFWGPPGTGKTFAAACIANGFLESADPFAPDALMTTLAQVLRQVLACSPQERESYFQKLLSCRVLILDDFGMERQTDFAREQVFSLVDGRYLSGRPMVITTNLTLDQMKHPETMAQQRIYDRILEVCVPVCFDGESLRREKAAENLKLYRSLMEG